MSEPATIRDQFCLNPQCQFYTKTLSGNVLIHSAGGRRLKCKACGKTWASSRREKHYLLKHSSVLLQQAAQLLQMGYSVRLAAKELEVSPSTVQRWKTKLLF